MACCRFLVHRIHRGKPKPIFQNLEFDDHGTRNIDRNERKSYKPIYTCCMPDSSSLHCSQATNLTDITDPAASPATNVISTAVAAEAATQAYNVHPTPGHYPCCRSAPALPHDPQATPAHCTSSNTTSCSPDPSHSMNLPTAALPPSLLSTSSAAETAALNMLPRVIQAVFPHRGPQPRRLSGFATSRRSA